MTDLAKHARSDKGILMPGQTLTEQWTIKYTRPTLGHKIEARLDWPHPTIYCTRGEGNTIEEARLHLVLRLAGEIAHDTDPHLTSREAIEGLGLAVEAARLGMGEGE